VYEKNAWTGDAQLTSGTASILFDTERLYRKLFQDMRRRAERTRRAVAARAVEPELRLRRQAVLQARDCCGATPAWDAFWFVIPWEAYQRFGDRARSSGRTRSMRKYLDEWIPRWTDKDGDGSRTR
jgi:alpha-L-rhamnosidase